MKAILIFAAIFMTGASVYGIIDYNKKASTKEFKQLYAKEKETSLQTIILKKETTISDTSQLKEKGITKEEKPVSEKIEKKKIRKFRLSEFSRAPLR